MFSRPDSDTAEGVQTLIDTAREQYGAILTPGYAQSLLKFLEDTYAIADEQAASMTIGRRLLERLALLSDSRAKLVSLRSIVRSDDERAFLKGLLK